MRTLCAIAGFGLSTALAGQQFIDAPCFETALGSPTNLGQNGVAQNLGLGFTLSIPGRGLISAAEISTNGFLWLGHNVNPACCNGNVAGFLSDTPRIALLWADLESGGSQTRNIYYNAIPGNGSHPARFVATWLDVAETGTQNFFTMQLQLLADGSFSIFFDQRARIASHTALTGFSIGQGTQGSAVDFAAIQRNTPLDTGTNPTVYELFTNSFGLAGRRFEFVPNGHGGYFVQDHTVCLAGGLTQYGYGCPQPTTVYETFPSGNTIDLSNNGFHFQPDGHGGYQVGHTGGAFFTALTNNLNLGDDQVARNIQLPFPFGHAGGSTTAIDISANGQIYLEPGTILTARCCDGDIDAFRNGTAAIAVLWEDLSPQLSGFGGVYFDADPANQACYVTWANCPEHDHPGTAYDAQLAMFADGSFDLRYLTVGNRSHVCLVGYTAGHGARDPGARDLSASVPFATGPGGSPLQLREVGAQPAIGAAFQQDLVGSPSGSPMAFVLLGLLGYPTGIDLSSLGMPGCRQWSSAEAVHLTIPTPPASVRFQILVPDCTILVGTLFFEQAAVLGTPGGSLPVMTSNGMRISIGG
jgi:hypothetical protein